MYSESIDRAISILKDAGEMILTLHLRTAFVS